MSPTIPAKLEHSEIEAQLTELLGWSLNSSGHIARRYRFPDFKAALNFVNQVGELAEKRDHHPDILLRWGEVNIELWTHSAGGITQLDIELASAINEILCD